MFTRLSDKIQKTSTRIWLQFHCCFRSSKFLADKWIISGSWQITSSLSLSLSSVKSFLQSFLFSGRLGLVMHRHAPWIRAWHILRVLGNKEQSIKANPMKYMVNVKHTENNLQNYNNKLARQNCTSRRETSCAAQATSLEPLKTFCAVSFLTRATL